MKREAKKDFPILKKNCEILLKFCDSFIETEFDYDGDDHFAFMLLCFLSKEYEHFNSLLLLINSQKYSDATIIARSMLEGMGIISWTSYKANERAFRWRNYCVVTDFRLLLERRSRNENLPIEEENKIIDRAHKEGQIYIRPKYLKENVQQKNLPEDPFRYDWLFDEDGEPVKPEEYFTQGNRNELYGIYREMSDWIHWNVNKIGTRIKRNKGKVNFEPFSINDAALSLSAGFASMHYILDVTNQYLKLNYTKELKSIFDEYKNGLNT